MGWTFNPFTGNFDNTGPSTTPAGSDTHVQYNDSGAFGGDANNTWNKTTKLATLTHSSLTTTTAIAQRFTTSTAATNAVRVQAGPATQWRSNGWRTTGGGSNRTADFNAYSIPTTGTNEVIGEWRLDYSLNAAAAARGLQYYTNVLDGVPVGLFRVNGFQEITGNNSSTIDTLQNLDIVNSTGSQTHFTYTFGSTIRYGISNNTNGSADYKTAGTSAQHSFYYGTSITSQTLIAQLYSSGIYCSYNGYFGQSVTAGSADTSVQTTLSAYGSFATKGVYVNSATYTLDQTHTVVYCDPSNANFCTGTPAACSSYTGSGEATCNSHTAVGCSWFAGTACSGANGTNSSTCTDQGAGCTWESVSCTGANNTDQTTCETQDDAYGGSCSWDTSTCPAFVLISTCDAQEGCTPNTNNCTDFNGSSEATCEFNGECTWTGADCHTFDATDQATCETGHTGCTWTAGPDTCDGVYDEASTCAGNYLSSCSGNLCNGTYNTGNCLGTYGAACQGTADCGNLTDDGSGPCNAESGCTWTTGIQLKFPLSSNSLRSTTGREYTIINIGSTGVCSISGQTNENIFQYGTSISLLKKGDKGTFHNQNVSFPCSILTASGSTACNAQSGCQWHPVIVCSSHNGDEATCTSSPYSSYCSWNSGDSTCTGVGNPSAFCNGNYNTTDRWYVTSLERGLNYVSKTANYTLTSIDDVIDCTANSFTLTLPSASLNNGKQYTLKNTGTGTITLNTTSSQTIDGNASGVLTLNTGDAMTVMSNNSNWVVI